MMILSLLLAATLSSGNAEFERMSVDTAANIACAQARQTLLARGVDPEDLERAMLAAPSSFVSRAAAEKRCRTLARALFESNYLARVDAILSQLGVAQEPSTESPPMDRATSTKSPQGRAGASSRRPYHLSFVTDPDCGLKIPTLAAEREVEAALDRSFKSAFETARAAACRQQAASIALKVKPDEAELEAKSGDEARRWLTDRIASTKGLCVFEENRKYISDKIVDPLLADARRERKRQQDYLMRARCESESPARLAAELEANLRKNVSERKMKCENPERAWNVFPRMLARTLPTAVERRIFDDVIRAVEETPFAVETNDVKKTIEAEPSAHRKAADSERLFRPRFAAQLTARAIERASQDVPFAERREWLNYVCTRTNVAELARTVETRVRRDVMPQWRAVRRALAENAVSSIWPTLADRTWYPSAELADVVVARTDYERVLGDWRKIPEMKTLACARGALPLEESDAAADKSVVRAFDLARKAIAAQRAIVEAVHPQILADARERKNSFFRRTPDLKAVAEMMTGAVEERWNETRLATLWGDGPRPANGARQHVQLFPSVRREIERVARQILSEMVEETPKDKPDELCTISFEVGGGEVTVRAKRGESVVAERKAKATAKGFENAVREVGAVVGREVFKLK